MDYQWVLRPTVAEDEPFLWRVLFYASHSHDEEGVEPSAIVDNPDLSGYVEGWRNAGFWGVIAEVAGEPAGAAWLRLLGKAEESNPIFAGFDVPELAVAVLPGYEGRGIGTAMIEAVLAESRARHDAVVLSVRADNPAVRLYERLGFRIVGEIPNRAGTRSLKMVIDF